MKSLYEFGFNNLNSYFLIFFLYFLIFKNLIDIYEERSDNLINFLPFIYLFTFIFSGFNFSLLATLFIYIGLVSYLNREGNSIFNFLYVFLSLWWLINSNGSYYFNVESSEALQAVFMNLMQIYFGFYLFIFF